ncbi:Trk system potassium transporter TrkA [Kordiimonas sp. SCSIO 12610]|uniref:Trk system potassium transporter TrkA n=1 Tax=Kordiimonas sp. SCSIO 12610 TaxID=2829597 RepID=UPI00210C477B|nr:Trk system potassium transporter TrkA [Kordiimonas sp. SCSIO 12610]UTW54011.1 Trk system potassium transporter TrkA [Kordiimonas sp. SCSIO 12610]
MKVIVCGAGQVGFNIAKYLAEQQNDVTVIDRSPELIRKISESLDVKAVVGHASDPQQLEVAGADDTEMLIAVTISDEVNMVACQVAHSVFNIPTKIARIRNQVYLKPKWRDLFSRSHLPIDVIISPELEVARALLRRIEVPGAFNMMPFVDGKVRVIGLLLDDNCPVINTPLRQLTELFPKLLTTVVGVVRGDKIFVPRSDDTLHVGDAIYIAVDTSLTERAMAVFGHEEKSAQRTIIVGGGNVGMFLAQLLEEHSPSMNLKVIEYNQDRANYVAEKLNSTIVINGDALDREILQQANIEQTDTIISVADDDEVNILSSLLAKQQGCQRSITLMNNPIYANLVNSIGIDVALDPREMTVSSILRHVRRGRIRDLHSICDGHAEVIEAEVIAGADIAGKKIGELRMHSDVRFGLIVRDGETIVPHADTQLEPGDRVVLVALLEAVKKIEQLFSARVEMF